MLVLLLAAAVALPVPYVAQGEDTCGAASLAMVLRFWGRGASQDEIARELFDRELHGIRGSRLVDLAARRGLFALAYEGDLAQLRDYLDKGRPLIAAWKVTRDRYHNVVVVGHDPARQELVVHDPAEGPSRRLSEKSFEKLWKGSGHWTLLVIPRPE
jgi:ABC-type bacteriocin/lantibiotic exporter with double-glycine peptidase domain